MKLPLQKGNYYFPGAQKYRHRSRGLRLSVYALNALITGSVLMLGYDLLRINACHFGAPYDTWFSIRLLSAETAAVIASGLLAFSLSLTQHRQKNTPIMVYDSEERDVRNTPLIVKAGEGRAYFVNLRNAGDGVALFQGEARYIVKLKNPMRPQDDFSYRGALQYLDEHGLRRGEDYLVWHKATGAAFRGGFEKPLAFFSMHFIRAVIDFDVIITFSSIFGELYSKEIRCVPRYRRPGWDDAPPAPAGR